MRAQLAMWNSGNMTTLGFSTQAAFTDRSSHTAGKVHRSPPSCTVEPGTDLSGAAVYARAVTRRTLDDGVWNRRKVTVTVMPNPVDLKVHAPLITDPGGQARTGEPVFYVLYDDGSVRLYRREDTVDSSGRWLTVAPADDEAQHG